MREPVTPAHGDTEHGPPRLRVPVGLLAATGAAALTLCTAELAQGRAISVVGQNGELRLIDPLTPPNTPTSLFQPPPSLPAGINTDAYETLTSVTDRGNHLTFARSPFNAFNRGTPFVADLGTGTVSPIVAPAPTDPEARAERFALSPDGQRGVVVFGTRDENRRSTEAVVVDASGTKSGPFPEIARYTTPDGFTDEGKQIVGAQVTNDGRVAWSTRFRTNVVTVFGTAVAGPGLGPFTLSAQRFPYAHRLDMRFVTGFGNTLVGHTDNIQVTNDLTLMTDTTAAPVARAPLSLPNLDLDRPSTAYSRFSATTDGRYFAWVENDLRHQNDAVRRFKVYDTQTQGLVQDDGRVFDGGPIDGHVLVDLVPPVIASFTVPPTVRISGPARPVLKAQLKVKAPVGIVVHKIAGKTTIGERRVDRLRLVGRVPLGNRKRGANAIPWDGRVAGKKLTPGKYQITLRALAGGKPVELSTPRKVTVR